MHIIVIEVINMSKLRKLTIKEIEKLANRKGVRKIAVENFLITLTNNLDSSSAYTNLNMDARLYKWNGATRNAIAKGIQLASRKLSEYS